MPEATSLTPTQQHVLALPPPPASTATASVIGFTWQISAGHRPGIPRRTRAGNFPLPAQQKISMHNSAQFPARRLCPAT
jgi:hypothetical protein